MRAAKAFLLAFALTGVLPGLVASAHAAEAAASGARRKPTQSESYVMVEPLYASILQGLKPRGLLLVEVGLDVPDPVLRARVTEYMPLLRDAYVRSLAIYAANAVRPWRQPSIDEISARMQKITDYLMGKPGAKILMAQTAIRVTQ